MNEQISDLLNEKFEGRKFSIQSVIGQVDDDPAMPGFTIYYDVETTDNEVYKMYELLDELLTGKARYKLIRMEF